MPMKVSKQVSVKEQEEEKEHAGGQLLTIFQARHPELLFHFLCQRILAGTISSFGEGKRTADISSGPDALASFFLQETFSQRGLCSPPLPFTSVK